MSKIIILVLANLIGTGLAQDISAAICATPSDYDGSHEYVSAASGTKMTCDQIAASYGLSSTTKQCTDVKPDGQYESTLKELTNHMATTFKCCGSTEKSACWEDVSAAMCATPSNYDGAHEFSPPGSSQSMTCDTILSQVNLPSTDATCDSAPGPTDARGSPGPSKDYITTAMAQMYGCCGGTSHYLLIFFCIWISVTKNIIH